jgi:hypothetical protein
MGWKINIDVQYERERKKKNEKRRKKNPQKMRGNIEGGARLIFFPATLFRTKKKRQKKGIGKNFDNEMAKENPFSSPFLRRKREKLRGNLFRKACEGEFFPLSLIRGNRGGTGTLEGSETRAFRWEFN